MSLGKILGYLGLINSSLLFCQKITFKAQDVVFFTRGASPAVQLTGQAYLGSDFYQIHANQMLIWGAQQEYLEGSNQVVLESKQEGLVIKSDSFSLDRLKEKLVLKGNVDLVYPKESIKLSAMEVQLFEKGAYVIAIGAVRFSNEKAYAEAETLRFDKKKETLELIGQARLQAQGQRLQAGSIWFNLASQQLIVEDQVSGQLTVTEENLEEEI